jgi:hypothetical protein
MAQGEWVDRRHPDYKESSRRRKYARDHYTGAALDLSVPLAKRVHTAIKPESGVNILTDTRTPELLTQYLHKRAQGEADGAFEERAKISRYPNHMATIVDSFVGGVFSVEAKADRGWGDVLGDPLQTDSAAYTLLKDIDGTGTNWMTRLVEKTSDLIVDEAVWYYADRSNGRSRVFVIDPDRVVQWLEVDGMLTEVLVEEFPVTQGTLVQSPVETHDYIHYTLDGWTRYREVGEGNNRSIVAVEGEDWAYPFYVSADRKQRRLPLGRVSLPIKRPVGYQMARDANALYNMLSDARWLYRVMNYPRLKGDVDDSQWVKSLEALKEGMNAVQGDWDYISPPHMNASSVYEDYRHEVREFFISNHQRANQSAIEKSATEVLYAEAAGRTAFLTLLCQAVDEIENEWLFLVSQLEAPERPDEWNDAFVARSKDFKPIDADLEEDRKANRYAIYASTLPTPLALQFAGFDEAAVAEYVEFNPVQTDEARELFDDGEGEEEFIPPTEGVGTEPEVDGGGDS